MPRTAEEEKVFEEERRNIISWLVRMVARNNAYITWRTVSVSSPVQINVFNGVLREVAFDKSFLGNSTLTLKIINIDQAFEQGFEHVTSYENRSIPKDGIKIIIFLNWPYLLVRRKDGIITNRKEPLEFTCHCFNSGDTVHLNHPKVLISGTITF